MLLLPSFSCYVYRKRFEICVGDENYEDIRTYVTDKLRHSIRGESMAQVLQQEIITRATGSFQWVILVLSQVFRLYCRGKSLGALQAHIQKNQQN